VGGLGRSKAGAGAAGRRQTWRLRLAAATVIALAAAGVLAVEMPSAAAVRPSLAASRTATDLGLTKATALKVRAGRTYTVTLAGKRSQRWLVVKDPYDPSLPCRGHCPHRAGVGASALVEASVQGRGGTCVARAKVLGPTYDGFSGTERRLGRGLVASRTTFTAVVVPTWFGRIYLGLSPDRRFRCPNARYAVRLTLQRALAQSIEDDDGSASAAQYSRRSTTLAQKQFICLKKGQALDRYQTSLTKQIVKDQHRHGLGTRIAQLRAAINTATRKYRATPCPPT
jgi:hypothetical protein